VGRPAADEADIEQATQLAGELDLQVAVLRFVLASLAEGYLPVRDRFRINFTRHEIAALRLFRHRLRDRFGV
jgi:hypothetical protein